MQSVIHPAVQQRIIDTGQPLAILRASLRIDCIGFTSYELSSCWKTLFPAVVREAVGHERAGISNTSRTEDSAIAEFFYLNLSVSKFRDSCCKLYSQPSPDKCGDLPSSHWSIKLI